ncbi:apolipoprotein N-acyltransferase [Microvirga sp. 17 mud 1-3]|uniref:apolipoprotein N-acyltransferase n=1 Tax=Microvirga sp. 17 mud 1-3 TaxID=2082949 RepID=UPI000D6BD1B0|nr:apolipoprotein N-acyltransferase [Microvirga sp. 17 mud 1-3]AWM88794.1 apolipoprotein N-acyltransferase [Microvirga sp. 17 mud 1-3]
MKTLSQRAALATGWRRGLVAVASGAVGALAMPPFGALPALFLSLTPALWLIDGSVRDTRRESLKAATLAGWLWGFGYFVAGLWWLGAAFLVEADQFAWALPFGVLGLPALLAFFPAFGFALARLLWSSGPGRLCAFAFALTVSEWLRGHLFTGFPWNTLGMALGQNPWLMQSASLVGLYGLTVLAVLIGAAPALLASDRPARERWAAPVLAAALLALMAGFGAWRMPDAPLPPVSGVRLRLMQPNLPQDAKFHPGNREAIMRRYLTLSAAAPQESGRDPTHIIWPESAFPFLLHRSPAQLNQIATLLAPGTHLVTGAARMDDPLPGEEVGKFFNAIQVIDDRGTILGSYDKVHLVPFGEYVPAFLDTLIRAMGLRQFVHIPGGFEPSARRTTLAVPGLPPVAATICYEAIFPGEFMPEGPRPQLILNVTNDAWFGNTPGPYQHFAQARLRSVEEGLPLVRDANTGISAVVDPYGRVIASLPLGGEGVLDADLPPAIPPPFQARVGTFVLTAMLLICLMAAMAHRRRRVLPS